MLIYKYKPVNEYLYDLLINNELYFASPSEFNDPFDSKLPFEIKSKKEEWIAFLESAPDSFYNNFMSKKEALKKASELRTDTCTLVELFPNTGMPFILHERITNNLLIFSAASKNDNLLMWSHYSQQHKGICVGFNTTVQNNDIYLKIEPQSNIAAKHPISTDNLLPMNLVNYTLDLPKMCSIKEITEPNSLVKLASNKFKNWEYEEEIRSILFYPVLKSKKVKFDKHALNCIIFGMYTPVEQRRSIRRLVKELYIEKGFDVKFYKAITSINKYVLKIIDYKYFEDLDSE